MLVRRSIERRPVVLGTAALLSVLIFVAVEHFGVVQQRFHLDEAISLLYMVPVALVGLELGLGAGLGAALGALALLAVWMATRHPDLEAVGFATRAVAMISVGSLAGRFSDRMKASMSRQERLLESGLELARLDKIEALPETLAEQVQRTVQVGAVRVELADAPTAARGEPDGEALSLPISSQGVGFGTLAVSPGAGRVFGPEERIVLAMLALQGATAAHNQRLLAVERAQAALHSELELTRRRVSEQLRSADRILGHHEAERREIAHQLHEQAAQTVAAALIALSLIEHDAGGAQLDRSKIETVRCHMRDCLAELRGIATGLRPALLDELGLIPALESICAERGERAARPIALRTDGRLERLDGGVESSAYRTVEEVLGALSGATEVRTSMDGKQGRLRIAITEALSDRGAARKAEEGLAMTRARLELLDGSLRVDSRRGENGSSTLTVHADIPLRPA